MQQRQGTFTYLRGHAEQGQISLLLIPTRMHGPKGQALYHAFTQCTALLSALGTQHTLSQSFGI